MFYIFVFVVLAQCYQSILSVTVSLQFSKTVRLKCGPQRLGSGWTSRSKLDCVAMCRERFGLSCNCFMYNKLTKLCTPCLGISSYSTPASNTEGDLFFTETCDGYQDFRFYSDSSNPAVYAAYIGIYLNYTQATSVCQCLNSNMYSAKTSSKYSLFLSITGLQNFDWIGLDDMKTEGKFVWADDGSEIEILQKIMIFALNQPDNGFGSNEDCAEKFPAEYNTSGRLNDVNCGNSARFVCEKPNC